MVAPLAIGLGLIAPALGAAAAFVLGKKEYLWVAHSRGGALVAHKGASEAEAKEMQTRLAQQGHASLIIRQASDGTLTSENFTPGVAVSPAEREAMKKKWQSRAMISPRRWGVRRKLGAESMDISTPEIELDVTQKPEDRVPTQAAWRAQVGPYPRTERFYTTPSSHEYKTLVETAVLPAVYQPRTFFNPQTRNLVELNPYRMDF